MELSHIYPDIAIEITLYKAKILQGALQMLEHNDLRWISVDEIKDFEFCPADEIILQRLLTEGL